MHTSNLIELLVSLVLEIWLVVLVFKRRIRHLFPVFFTFTLYTALVTIARLATAGHYRSYFYVYWCTDALLVIFSLASLHEVFHWVFEGFYRLWWFRLFYYGTITVALAIAVRSAFVSPPVHAHPVISLILDIGIAVNFVLAGIVALFYVLKKLIGIEPTRYAYGIVAGFGISSGGFLIAYLLFSGFGTKVDSFARNAPAVAYILGVAIWVASFIRPEPEEKEWQPPMSPEQMLEEVQGYLRALGLLKRKQ